MSISHPLQFMSAPFQVISLSAILSTNGWRAFLGSFMTERGKAQILQREFSKLAREDGLCQL
jgi:hypothetical protein